MIQLIEDCGQQTRNGDKHSIKHAYWGKNKITCSRHPLPCGDYIAENDKVLDVISRKEKRGICTKKMDFLGTYTVAVDTKRNIEEAVGNICGKQHARFRDECVLAQNNGIKLYILVENEDGVTCIDDLFQWQNPRMHRYNKIAYMHRIGKWQNVKLPAAKPTSGQTLAKAMLTMQLKYGVEFLFCHPLEAGEKIINLLNQVEA